MKSTRFVIWTTVICCVAVMLVGVCLMILEMFDHSHTDREFRYTGLLVAVPMFIVLALAKPLTYGISERYSEKLLHPTSRYFIWGILAVLLLGVVLLAIWVVSMEHA